MRGLTAAMLKQLPFELTNGQREVLEVISGEMGGTRPMNRMLQGEVGSGKTIVSILAMLQMVDAGMQCALLAPTEVLAAQHYRSIRQVLGPLAMAGELGAADGATAVTLLTGSMTSAQQHKQRLQATIDRYESRMAMAEARYRKQFTALETMLSQLQSQGSALTSLIKGLPSSSRSND